MKNIIIGPAFPLRGGIANFNEALCKAFIKSGTDSHIVSFSLQYPSLLFPGKTQFDTSGNAPQGMLVIPMINSIAPLNWFKAANYIIAQKPDYVIIRYWLPFMAPCLGTIAKIIKRKTKVPIIAITDNILPHEKRIGDEMLSKYFVKHCDGFVAMSRSVLNELEQLTHNPNKKFIPHPVYDIFGDKVDKTTARRELCIEPDERYILFFGFIRKYKGLDLLLEAMADERIKKMGIKLIVAGEFYESDEYYKSIIREKNIADSLLLHTTFIPGEKVKHYFCASDMIVQPYRSATQSGVTQIAYHFERPMLVTNVGGLSEIVPHEKVGYVCDVNPRSIADSIVDFYSNAREKSFSENAAKEKHRFSWEAFVKGVEEMVTC